MMKLSLTHYLIRCEREHGIDSDLRLLLETVARACKTISHAVGKGALGNVLGSANTTNIQGEAQKKLDVLSNEILFEASCWGGFLAGMASEEMDAPMGIPVAYPRGKYLLLFDPLDGSSNIDVNVSIGTIFSIHRRLSAAGPGELSDVLQTGRTQVAAGYVIYGSSTMMVYSTGQGVHGFTLDPTIGEFVLSHPNIRTPARGKYYSVNESYFGRWSRG